MQCKRCQRFGHTQRNCGYAPLFSRVVAPTSPVGALLRGIGFSAVTAGAVTRRTTGTVLSGKKRRRSLQTSARACPKGLRHRPVCPSGSSADQALCRADGPGRGVESLRLSGRVVKATTTPPQTKTHSSTGHEVARQPKVTATRKTAGTKKPDPKSTAATKQTAGKSKKKAASCVKTAAAKPTTPDFVVPTRSPISPLEDISDMLDRLPLQACVELTRRLLTSISFLPTGVARPWAVLKTVIIFVAEYGSTP